MSMNKNREQMLAAAFVELADTLVADFDVVDFLHGLADRCVRLLAVDAAGLMLADQRGSLRVIASSSEQARLVELFQLQHEEGPCLECFQTGLPVSEPDLATAGQRWPAFAPAAAGAGFAAAQALPMRLRDEVIGAMNLFMTVPGRLDETALRVGPGAGRRGHDRVAARTQLPPPGGTGRAVAGGTELAGRRSSRPRGCWRSGGAWTWARRSNCCALRRGRRTGGWPSWQARWLAAWRM